MRTSSRRRDYKGRLLVGPNATAHVPHWRNPVRGTLAAIEERASDENWQYEPLLCRRLLKEAKGTIGLFGKSWTRPGGVRRVRVMNFGDRDVCDPLWRYRDREFPTDQWRGLAKYRAPRYGRRALGRVSCPALGQWLEETRPKWRPVSLTWPRVLLLHRALAWWNGTDRRLVPRIVFFGIDGVVGSRTGDELALDRTLTARVNELCARADVQLVFHAWRSRWRGSADKLRTQLIAGGLDERWFDEGAMSLVLGRGRGEELDSWVKSNRPRPWIVITATPLQLYGVEIPQIVTDPEVGFSADNLREALAFFGEPASMEAVGDE